MLLLALLLFPSCHLAGDGTAAPVSLELEPCKLPGARSARCGWYRVPEDRRKEGGRKIDLYVVVLPARGEDRASDPILFLHGGPGAAATALAPLFERSSWRDRRDIILVDQRGTGESSPLNCPVGDAAALLDELASFSVAGIEACRERLARRADLSMYTTSIAVEDLEEVRVALGAPRVNLIGGSYGTRVALDYLRRYPDSVRTATLRGIAPPSLSLPSEFDGDSMRALDHVLEDCAADAGCLQAFPDPYRELGEVTRTLEKKPGTARIRDPRDGTRASISVTRQIFVASLHHALYLSASASHIPYWIHEAQQGRYEDLVQSSLNFAAALEAQLSTGLFLSVTCAEDAPFYDPDRVVAGARDTLLRGSFSVALSKDCVLWPVPPASAGFKEPVRSSVPVLLLSGEADPVTPPRVAEEAATHLEHSLHVVLPEMGHSELSPGCAGDLVERFLDAGTVEGLRTDCVSSMRRPRFKLR